MELVKGLVPPSAIDLEKAVLGALINDSRCVDEVLTLIKDSSVFYDEKHVYIYEAVLDLYNKSQKIDLLTVSDRLKFQGKLETVGGDFYLMGLVQKVSSTANVEYHSRIILQKWMAREFMKIGSNIIAESSSETTDIFDVQDYLERSMDMINNVMFTNANQLSMKQAVCDVVDRVELLTNMDENELTGVPTGFTRLNAITGGWQPSDLIVIPARPGMGKSALCSAFTLAAVKSDNPVGIITLEMSTIQFVTRIMANNSHFHLNQLYRKGFREDAENKRMEYFKKLNVLKNEMMDYPVYFNDKPALDIKEIKSTARTWKRMHGIKLLIVDYLQLAKDSTKQGNREQEISSISGTLKALAKELDIPVIALSQLSRKVEDRGGMKIPQLSDIRESGAIEQDADLIGFIWRPGYYGFDVPEELELKGGNTGLMIKKHRNGSLDDIALWFDENKTKFCDPHANKNNAPF